MNSNTVQYNAAPVPKTKVVNFIGTTTLRDGQALCYQELAANAVKGLGTDVEVPNSDNIGFFAGFVDAKSAGVTGPCLVTIIVPERGDVLEVEVDGTTDVSVADKLTLQSTSGLEGFAKDASPAYTDHPLLTALAARSANSLGKTKVFVDQA